MGTHSFNPNSKLFLRGRRPKACDNGYATIREPWWNIRAKALFPVA